MLNRRRRLDPGPECRRRPSVVQLTNAKYKRENRFDPKRFSFAICLKFFARLFFQKSRASPSFERVTQAKPLSHSKGSAFFHELFDLLEGSEFCVMQGESGLASWGIGDMSFGSGAPSLPFGAVLTIIQKNLITHTANQPFCTIYRIQYTLFSIICQSFFAKYFPFSGNF